MLTRSESYPSTRDRRGPAFQTPFDDLDETKSCCVCGQTRGLLDRAGIMTCFLGKRVCVAEFGRELAGLYRLDCARSDCDMFLLISNQRCRFDFVNRSPYNYQAFNGLYYTHDVA